MVDVFMHVPKAAGTTIRSLIESNYAPAEQFSIYRNGGVEIHDLLTRVQNDLAGKRIIYGHIPVVIHEYVGPCDYFTFLRDPVDRAISFFKYVKYDFPQHNPRFASGVVKFSDWCKRRNNYEFNRQVKMLAGEERADVANRDLLNRAKITLSGFKYFGFFESFPESVRNCAAQFGWSLDGMEVRNISSRSNDEFLADEGASEKELESLRATNAFDLELYEFARELAIKRGFVAG